VLRRSYYLTLGCGTNAGESEIHHAFRKLAQHYHPDRLGPNSLAFFNDIVEAYRALRNLDQRISYAKGLHDAEESGNSDVTVVQAAAEEPEFTLDVPAVAHVFNRIETTTPSRGRLWDGVAERVLRNFIAGESLRRNRAEAIDLQVLVSADDALEGGVALIEVPTFYPCATCHASGRYDGEACLECAERGVVEESEEIRVVIPRLLADYTRMEVPVCGLGLHNFYLRLCFRIAAN
jgi:molecular chaperone DnaJ